MDNATYCASLTVALSKANAAARKASIRNDDGGTGRRDCVVLHIPRGMHRSVIQSAADDAGVDVAHTLLEGRGFILLLNIHGNGRGREIATQTAHDLLLEYGHRNTYLPDPPRHWSFERRS